MRIVHVADTALCYLYPPGSGTKAAFGDGTAIGVHYSDRMCFPAIPYRFEHLRTFGEVLGVGKDFDWGTLEYTEMCASPHVTRLIGPITADLTASKFFAAPYGSMLRIAEGIDAIENLIPATNVTEHERAAAILCGLAQFGGVLWLALMLVLVSVLVLCAPIGSLCCLNCCRVFFACCRASSKRQRQRDAAIDKLLATQNALVAPSTPIEDDEDIRTKNAKQTLSRALQPRILRGDAEEEKKPLLVKTFD